MIDSKQCNQCYAVHACGQAQPDTPACAKLRFDVAGENLWRSVIESLRPQNKQVQEEFIRASGDCVCIKCKKDYYSHPLAREKHNLSYDGNPFLNRLCDGTLVKL